MFESVKDLSVGLDKMVKSGIVSGSSVFPYHLCHSAGDVIF